MWCGIVGGMAIDRIVVGVDGSMNSLQAVEFAAEMAAAADAEVVAVHALGLLEHIDGDEVVPAYPNRHEIERRFRSEEHTSELQSLMRISYAVFCLNKK